MKTRNGQIMSRIQLIAKLLESLVIKRSLESACSKCQLRERRKIVVIFKAPEPPIRLQCAVNAAAESIKLMALSTA